MDIQTIAAKYRATYRATVSDIDFQSATLAAEMVLQGVPVNLAIWRAYDRHTSNPRKATGSKLSNRTTAQGVRPTTQEEYLRHLENNDTIPPSYYWYRLPHTARQEQNAGKLSARSKHRASVRTNRVTDAIDASIQKLIDDCIELQKLYALQYHARGNKAHKLRSQIRAVENRIKVIRYGYTAIGSGNRTEGIEQNRRDR